MSVPRLSPDGLYIAFRRALKTQIVSVGDGKPASPGIDNIIRTRWTADGRSLIFSIEIRPGPYNRGTRGLWLQDFALGEDTSGTRRPISSVEPSLDVETGAASPDGKRIVISVREFSRGLVLARNVTGVVRPEKK